MQAQTSIEVTIERILPGGVGLAHAQGRTLFVGLAAPGETVRVRIDRIRGKLAFASIEEIVTPSPVRIEPPCPYFGACGGCDFQQLNFQAQLDAKIEIIKDCLHRIGKIENLPDFQITRAPNPWHYRSRAQWQYDSVRKRLGYFESGSRRVCDVAECAVLVPELQRTLENLRQKMRENELPDEARDFRAVIGDDGVSISPDCGTRPTVREGSDLFAPHVTRTIRGARYNFNAESFFQTNADLLPQLMDTALGEASGETAVELYCGVGLFTVPLARRFTRVVGVEADTGAAKFAKTNLATAGLTNAEIANDDVADWLENLEYGVAAAALQRGVTPFEAALDFLLLDPPRAGAESRVISGILGLRPKRICYVSCDPATLARDLKKLIEGGYNLDSLAAFDMFPQTHHVETVVHLRR